MGERTNLRPADPQDHLVFHDMHEPLLGHRDYTLDLTQTLEARAGGDQVTGSTQVQLRVAGPQLNLTAGDVVATFPANLSADRYYSVLPHIMLSRGTLPWERDPRATGRGTGAAIKDPLPWLVLLILDEDELNPDDLSTVPASSLPAGILSADTHSKESVRLLELDATLVTSLLPPLDDLRWLAHVRRIEPPTGPAQSETATIVANRLPTAGRQNHALLISVEGRYRRKAFDVASATRVHVPVLHQWSFFCEAEPMHSFVELLTKDDEGKPIQPQAFIMNDESASIELQTRLSAGLVPVEHWLRNGDQSAAWYRGPLLADRPPLDSTFVESQLPANHADDLLLVDEEFSMFDVSYATAWELGRLLALEHTDIATALYHWKREFSHSSIRTTNDHGIAAMYNTQGDQQLPPMPALVSNWIQTGLLELRDVPFRHLVVDEALLPPSAFRFFDIDASWIECLRDGAISIGRTDGRARELETQIRDDLPTPSEMSGFLLRNSAVSDFPHLEVEGYTTAPAPATFGKVPLPIVRMDRLSPSVLLVIFSGRVKTVDLHLHPQALHFGFRLADGTAGDEAFEKDYKASTITVAHTNTTTHNHKAPFVGMNDKRRIKMADLAATLKVRSGDGAVADFASRMLEGVPMVRFSRSVRGH